MEQLLGKTVNLPGRALSSGTVTSYDSTSDSYQITDHDGASQQFTSSELAALLERRQPPPTADAVLIQSKPRRRGRTAEGNQPRHGGALQSGNVVGEGSGRGACESGCVDNCVSVASVRCVDGLNREYDSVCEVTVAYGSVEQRKLGFDLNLAANDTSDDQLIESGGRFDLNLGCDQLMDVSIDVDQDHYLTGGCGLDGAGQGAKFKKAKIGSPNANSEVAREGEENVFSRDINTKSTLAVSNASNISSPADHLKEAPSPDVTLPNNQHVDDAVTYQSGTCGRRRRQTSDTLTPISEPVLRRSARKSGATFSSSRVAPVYMYSIDQNSGKRSFLDIVDMSPSNVTRNLTEEGSPCEELEGVNQPPTKLQLPESSQDLNLDGTSMLDLISIYSFIRSFSTILFLSPFEMEDFCAALKCKAPTSLLDQTHVTLLQSLRKHLQFLSSEGSQSASDCLRSLNWDFLDPITWPLFIAEYLLIMKPDFDLRRLNLTSIEYYKQPESLKVDVLRILCDDLVDTECIRAEINRRLLVDEHEADPGVTNIRDSKRRRANVDLCNDSNLTGEVMDEAKDWNSDECCLCKVDGSLICCDGCPAAYHARCVGVTSDLLPEGEWYCPECNIDRDKAWKKHRVSLRGAESLGVDPDGRMYFGSCDCLLVLDSHEDKSAITYYCRNDLDAVIQVLKSSDIRYAGILNAISQHWGISVHQTEKKTGLSSRNRKVLMSEEDFLQSHQPLESSEVCSDRVGIADGRNEEDICNANTVRDHMKMVYQITSSEGSADTSHVQATMILQSSENSRGDLSKGPAGVSNPKPELPENLTSVRVPLMNDTLHLKVEQNSDSPAHAYPSGVFNIVPRNPSEDQKVIYSNYYSLAQVASSVAEELFGKCSEKTNKLFLKSNEGSVSSQLKAIIKKCSRFCWSSIRHLKFDARTEKCGWCYCCKAPDVDMDCLFKLYYSWPARKNLESQAIDHPSKWVGKGHLVDIIYYVLFNESRLQGLLLGPWLNPQHSAKWSRSILRSFDLASVKDALLMLESNLHNLVFSVEWTNDMDSAHTLGSASYAVTSSSCLGLKHGVSRKRGRSQHADSELLPTSNAATDLDFFWWRGGRTSRRLFNWKVLPHSLACKAARLAGGHKIPGIYYPEASEFAKRRKNSVWRAAVENSSSVEQIAYLIRELDSNIKWDDIENTNPFTKIDKKLTKASRLFKKVTIRRKKLEGTIVKYLLDFGKRRVIPEIVVTHGYIFEESASERKKYWLEESLVPMHMMKSFEENRICRKNYKMKSGKLVDVKLKKGCNRPRDFSYLFSRAEKSENCECGHCKKSVPIRESVRCQFCEDYFHKRHVRRSKEKDLTGDKYSCFKCHQDNPTKVETKKDSVRTLRSKGKKVTVTSKPVPQGKIRVCSRVAVATKSLGNEAVMQIPLRRSSRKIKFKFAPVKRKKRSPRKTKLVPVCKQKAAGRKRGRSAMAKKPEPRKVEDITPRQKRTQVHHSYWLNGLNLAKKSDDQRVVKFRREKLLVPSEDLNVILNQPVCTICSKFTSQLIYICCEVCEDWFHGRAFGVDADNVNYIIGFRCHSCCKRNPPVCPVLLERNLDGTGVLNKNKYSSGKGRSPSLEQLNVESLGDCLLSDPISEVVSNERESAMWNPDQIHHSEASARTEIEGTANGTVSNPHIDMERVLPTEIREHHTEKGCAALVKIHSLSPDPVSTAETNLGKLGKCDRVVETGAPGVPESSEIL